ncbi:hypothetical protein LSUB1_G001872 [Lachnellula subtilissima]|uniref:Uncharacterized protein n=1 Tax=Lachnellula subtilissima TaxID=602034 RepID=A0A8H8S1F2_9HELO|nr:hypothetical protein LSUB1_G001872 [Lachnellula subtilissima]
MYSQLLPLAVLFLGAGAQSYGFWFQPAATITTLNVTMVIPSIPASSGIHYIWPGLQPDSDLIVFQDVGGDEDGSGAWTFAEWEVDSNGTIRHKTNDIDVKMKVLGTGVNVCPAVYPGDSIAISFDLDTATGTWLDEWAITPGSTGKGAGEVFSITDVIVPESRAAAYGNLTEALFIIETYGGTWDFGHLVFNDITIVAETTETDWCKS